MSAKLKVYVTDFLSPPPDVEREVLNRLASVRVLQAKSEDNLTPEVNDAAALLVWHTIRISDKTIARLKRCNAIVRCGVGFDNVDLEAAGKKGIYVCNVPDYCVDEVSDHTIALMLSLHRKIAVYHNAVKSRLWDFRIAKPIRRLKGQTLGIIGLGRIGTATALKGKALGLKVVEYDPYVPCGTEKSLGIEAVDFHTLLATSDIISLHVPLTDETHHMIGPAELRKMKPTAIILNTSRGPVVDHRALYRALKESIIAGAGLDVFEQEPPPADASLLQLPNVVATPHVAFYSEDSFREVRRKAAEEVSRILRGEKPHNPVNMEFYQAT